MYRKKIIGRYANWSDVFLRCEHKTFIDADKSESRNYYVKQNERSDHKYAFTRKQMLKVVEVVFDIILEKLLQGEIIKTPLGKWSIRKYRCDFKQVGNKVYNQLNMMNYKVRLFSVGNYFARRSVMKFVFNGSALSNKIYPTIIKDTSLLFNYLTESSYKDRKAN